MCEYGYKTENTRFGMRAAIAKQVRGDAAPERFRFSVFQSGSVQGVCLSAARSAALVSRLSHIFMDTQLLIIAFLRIRTLDKLFEATIALVNFRICN